MADEQRGFAGFDGLVSDLSDLHASPALPANEEKAVPTVPQRSADEDRSDWEPPPESKKKPTKLIVAGLLVGGLIVAGMVSENNKKGQSVSQSSPQSTYAPPSAPSTPPHSPAPVKREQVNLSGSRITLKATADCWVQIIENGNLVLARMLRQGESYAVPFRPGLTLMVGNAGGIEVWVDGKKAPSLGRSGQVVRDVSLDPDKLMPKTKSPSKLIVIPPPADLEQRPPIGEGTVLSTVQLRYCLAQEVRIGGANKAMNLRVTVEVDRFNRLVDDYNARCGKARYRSSTMQSVKMDVESRRAYLENEGAGLIRSTASR